MQREIDSLRQQAQMQAHSSTELNENIQAIYLSSPSEHPHEDTVVDSDTRRQHENIEDQTTRLQKRITIPRAIDGLELESYKIDDCFSL
jgi:hypothetical protein